MNKIYLIIGIAVAAVLALGVTWKIYSGSIKTTSPIVSKVTTNCQAGDLDLAIGPSNGTAGTIYVDAVFTNQSQRTCTLKGYPAIKLVDSSNLQLGIAATNNSAFPATTVTLHPGQSAHAAMGFPEPGILPPGSCSAISTNLEATPPGFSTYLETPLARQSCTNFSITSIQPGI